MIHLLRTRGSQSLYTRRVFGLWRLARNRLQARQLLHGDEPLEKSSAWLGTVNQSRPDLHLIVIMDRVIVETSSANKLAGKDPPPAIELNHSLANLERLHENCLDWENALDRLWRPTLKKSSLQITEAAALTRLPHDMFVYHDMWAV